MSIIFGRRNLTAIVSIMTVSILTVGAALSVGLGQALAGENNVTEDQILQALSPPKKPLTRGLSVGPQADTASCAAEGAFVQKIRTRAPRSLSTGEPEDIGTIAQSKPNIDLEINFYYNSAYI